MIFSKLTVAWREYFRAALLAPRTRKQNFSGYFLLDISGSIGFPGAIFQSYDGNVYATSSMQSVTGCEIRAIVSST
jgi:hypothetical protein